MGPYDWMVCKQLTTLQGFQAGALVGVWLVWPRPEHARGGWCAGGVWNESPLAAIAHSGQVWRLLPSNSAWHVHVESLHMCTTFRKLQPKEEQPCPILSWSILRVAHSERVWILHMCATLPKALCPSSQRASSFWNVALMHKPYECTQFSINFSFMRKDKWLLKCDLHTLGVMCIHDE